DHVTLLDAGALRGAVLADAGDEYATHLGEVQAAGQVRRDRLRDQTEQAAAHAALLDQLRHHVVRHRRRDREPDADVAAGRREDLRVDPDQLAAQVDERAARVALV